MLRHYFTRIPVHRQPSLVLSRRTYAAASAAATSRQKRALDKQQLQGSGMAPLRSAAPVSEAPVAARAVNAPIPGLATSSGVGGGGGPPSTSGSGGGGGAVLGILAVVGAGGALAYYNGLIPGLDKKEEESPKEAVVSNDESSAFTQEAEETEKKEADDVPEKSDAGPAEDDEVTDEAEVVDASAVARKDDTPDASSYEIPPAKEVDVVNADVEEKAPKTILEESKIMKELEKVKAQLSREYDRALTDAHSELAKLSILNLDNLDDMTPTQLKVRLVHLVKEMEDRTKWEAIRLQEFMSMKEKEVEARYMLLIKKLRLEAESLMEERLAEQMKLLTSQSEKALQEQLKNSNAFIESSLKIQEQSFNEERAAFEKKAEEAMSAKYEELFGKSLAKVKEEFAAKLEKKSKQVESLSKKLSELEIALKSSKDFQEGSVQAHRITAAAIALSDKLESGEPAGSAINTLKAAASENAVVSSAVGALPSSVAEKGVSTLQALQASFEDEVYPQCRQAANVPGGQTGLEGQLLGMAFATLKYPPAPDDPAPESEKDGGEYVLARARRYVQLGELEHAVMEINKLNGQASFVAKDWAESVKARVAAEKALRVIRMECALANESLAQTPGVAA